MMNYNWDMMNNGGNPWFAPAFGLLAIWSLFWKGLALWKSARNGQRYWFIALLLVNMMGILELLYLFVFAKNKLVLVNEPKTTKPVTRKKAKK